MKIAVLGTRGIPNVQGGVESYCENLFPRIVQEKCEVVIFTRSSYVDSSLRNFKGVSLIPLWAPRNKYFEAVIHTFLGVFAAKKIRANILHVQAIGPSLLVPLARILNLKIIVTTQGEDYQREKWNPFAKLILRLGERFACKWAHSVICVSESIAEDIRKKYGRESTVIPNGVSIQKALSSAEILEKFGLEKGKYILAVGRFVPEKGFDDLIEAYEKVDSRGWKLAIVGRADHEDKYSSSLRKKAVANANIVLPGFLSGKLLQEIFSHAGLFVLASHHEGLPIALLEAMSYGLSCIVSDIPSNQCVGLSHDRFFSAGNVVMLAEKLKTFMENGFTDEDRILQINMIERKFNWDEIAHKTFAIYKDVLSKK